MSLLNGYQIDEILSIVEGSSYRLDPEQLLLRTGSFDMMLKVIWWINEHPGTRISEAIEEVRDMDMDGVIGQYLKNRKHKMVIL